MVNVKIQFDAESKDQPQIVKMSRVPCVNERIAVSPIPTSQFFYRVAWVRHYPVGEAPGGRDEIDAWIGLANQ